MGNLINEKIATREDIVNIKSQISFLQETLKIRK